MEQCVINAMTCQYCTLPDKLSSQSFVFIWPPQGHTLQKIVKYFETRNMSFENIPAENCLHMKIDDASSLLVKLSGLLTKLEAGDTRILVTASETPSLGEFGNVMTVASALRRVRSDWLIDILDQKRYVSYAQPIVSVDGGRETVAHEFLFRGIDEDGKLISPDTLFESAQDPRVFFNLDRAARICAVEAAAQLPTGTDVFINFMPGSIYDPAVCLRTTVQAAKENNIAPERVVFEIVESQRIDDLNHLRGIVNFYRDAGFRIALDDFGAGHSNLETFIALRPDFVKLDKALTSNLMPNDDRLDMVKAVTRTFHGAGIKVIAEGIETEENACVVTACGVDRMQGYYFARPMPIAEILAAG